MMRPRAELRRSSQLDYIAACGGDEATKEFTPKLVGFIVKVRGLIVDMRKGVAKSVTLI
jgi:hypothetical protein